MDKDTAKSKVAKLLALGTNEGATLAEAERAMAQAEKLMQKFGLDAADCAQGAQTFDWGSSFTPYGNKYHVAASLPLWYRVVALGVARFTDTLARPQFVMGKGAGVAYYGEANDVALAVWMTDYLRGTVQRMAAAEVALTRAQKEAFRRGMAARLQQRMIALRAERDQVMDTAGKGTALVVVSDKLAKRDAEFGAQESAKTKTSVSDRDAAIAGVQAAEKVGLHRPIAQTTATAKLAA